ncbi:MAG: hypothetical protein LM550_03365 [Candidatus Contendobacter sp.]|nr:hypothetical protein [Gammaproteobacteria bacterium]MCC8992726.1 hypothetical protein [Candidatus Contendobacter sp.]
MSIDSVFPTSSFTPRLAVFAADLTAKFAIALHFNPEDQLKAPMLTLAELLEKVLAGELFAAVKLPQPDEAQRRALTEKAGKAELFD